MNRDNKPTWQNGSKCDKPSRNGLKTNFRILMLVIFKFETQINQSRTVTTYRPQNSQSGFHTRNRTLKSLYRFKPGFPKLTQALILVYCFGLSST